MRRLLTVLAALVVAGVVAGAAMSGLGETEGSAPPVPRFRHVVLVVFENEEYGAVIGSRQAPTFNALARRYSLLTQSYAVSHPSLPNYLALVSGSTFGIRSDCTTCFVGGRSLADTLDGAGLSWNAYEEGLPSVGSRVPFAGRYAIKHSPFLYFRSVRSSQRLRDHVVPYSRFAPDLAGGRLPTFSLVVPNLCHSMHDCSVATGDRWLAGFLRPLLASPELDHSAVFVTFDEGSSSVHGGGRVATLVLGPLVEPGTRSSRLVTHYGVLRTIEDGLGLPRLGVSARARPITGIWR
jgi:phosphatidylinositol-3-phosphatase